MNFNLKPLNHKGKAQNKSEGDSSRGNKGCSEGSPEAGGLTILRAGVAVREPTPKQKI